MADRNMMLTFDEYMDLRRLWILRRNPKVRRWLTEASQNVVDRRTQVFDKKMSKALAQANAELRKVNGDLAKVYSRATS